MLTLILQSLWSDFKKTLAELLHFICIVDHLLFHIWIFYSFCLHRLRTCFCTSSFSKIADTLFESTLFLSC
mgnify:FL=1